MTKQPKWKQVGTIGDVNFTKYDGGPVFVDETGVYPPELEYVQRMPEPSTDAWVYRIVLDNLKLSPAGRVIPAAYNETWSHPIESYTEWFDDTLDEVARFVGIPRAEFVDALLSDNLLARAQAFESLAQYHGWENFDGYPLHLMNEAEIEARYAKHPYVDAEIK